MVPPQADRPGILKTLHYDVGPWDVNSTRDFVISRFWWPMVYRDIYDYVKSCDGCQRSAAVPHYKTDLHVPITTLFDIFSIDFAGPFPRTSSGNRFALVAVEHLTGWTIARATKNATASDVRRFMEMEVVNLFGPPRVVISDNAGSFTAEVLASYMREIGTMWKTVLDYAPMSNGRAKRMVGTLKKAVLKTTLSSHMEWDVALSQVVAGYRRRRLADRSSPFELMYGVPPRIMPTDAAALITTPTDLNRAVEIMALLSRRAARQPVTDGPSRVSSATFSVGDEVMVLKGAAANGGLKWPTFLSRFYGPCRIIGAHHPRYFLLSPSGRVSRDAVHARRLVLYRRRPTHLAGLHFFVLNCLKLSCLCVTIWEY